MVAKKERLVWEKVLDTDELAEGRVKPVTCQQLTVCMTHYDGQFGALDNQCPHQGGPMGEGSIENGLLRCPWHGWDYDPLTGKSPGYDDGVQTFEVEVRDDGVYVGFPEEKTHVLLNNNELGKISKEQKAGNWEVWQTSLHNPDFAEYANLCGAMGISVKKKEELDDEVSKALAHNGPSLVEINSDVELVQGGSAMAEMGLWFTPVLLISGVGLLILSTSVRYGQIHAEPRELITDAKGV